MLIRQASESDFDRLTEIWLRAVRATHDFLTEEEIAGYRERMPVDFLPAVELSLAEAEGGEPAGFIGMNGDRIEMLFVDPAHHGGGFGSALIDAVDAGRLRLEVDVNEGNPAALGFYESRGFERTGRSETDGDGRPFPLIHMTRV